MVTNTINHYSHIHTHVCKTLKHTANERKYFFLYFSIKYNFIFLRAAVFQAKFFITTSNLISFCRIINIVYIFLVMVNELCKEWVYKKTSKKENNPC